MTVARRAAAFVRVVGMLSPTRTIPGMPCALRYAVTARARLNARARSAFVAPLWRTTPTVTVVGVEPRSDLMSPLRRACMSGVSAEESRRK